MFRSVISTSTRYINILETIEGQTESKEYTNIEIPEALEIRYGKRQRKKTVMVARWCGRAIRAEKRPPRLNMMAGEAAACCQDPRRSCVSGIK
ncbi:hypothetical protein E2C01_076251 [Portunus trituberculatus]|uniref:Uncharacterized protein n=1 Tax=Portunus trituberculatus TaxID=210409 RepID=A0A5B7ICS0_PORTR|nr:hypothetical protein [Portunus trituberculatus]